MRSSKVAFAAAALSIAWCSPAWADEASEKALAQKVEELQKQLDSLSKRMSDGANRSDDELEQRIAELEKITKKDQDGLFAYWKNGLRMDSADGQFKLSIFGRLQNDWVFFDADSEVTDEKGEMSGGTEFRRARIGLGGTIYKNVVYKFEMDFAGGSSANWADAYMELKDPTCGVVPMTFRVGHFDEPMGLDRVTSSKYGTFLERGLQETFVPGRNTGFMLYGPALDNRMAWFAGYFRDSNGNGDDLPSNVGDPPATPSSNPASDEDKDNDNNGEHNITMRVTGRPYLSEDGSQWVHLGASYSLRNPTDEKVQYRSRPEIHQGPFIVDTGTIPAVDKVNLFGLEGGGVAGPLSLSAEWLQSSLSGVDGRDSNGVHNVEQRDFDFTAKSVQVSYFLTGETREYDVAMARWDRIKVKKNYGTDGMGAWEVAARWSHLNLNDGPIDGGSVTDLTLGLNWYLNPNTRVMFNFIHVDRQDLDSYDVFGVRFAVDF